eukprot:1354127-Amorphochlora_amoeboformis.AAC.1
MPFQIHMDSPQPIALSRFSFFLLIILTEVRRSPYVRRKSQRHRSPISLVSGLGIGSGQILEAGFWEAEARQGHV